MSSKAAILEILAVGRGFVVDVMVMIMMLNVGLLGYSQYIGKIVEVAHPSSFLYSAALNPVITLIAAASLRISSDIRKQNTFQGFRDSATFNCMVAATVFAFHFPVLLSVFAVFQDKPEDDYRIYDLYRLWACQLLTGLVMVSILSANSFIDLIESKFMAPRIRTKPSVTINDVENVPGVA